MEVWEQVQHITMETSGRPALILNPALLYFRGSVYSTELVLHMGIS